MYDEDALSKKKKEIECCKRGYYSELKRCWVSCRGNWPVLFVNFDEIAISKQKASLIWVKS